MEHADVVLPAPLRVAADLGDLNRHSFEAVGALVLDAVDVLVDRSDEPPRDAPAHERLAIKGDAGSETNEIGVGREVRERPGLD